MTQNTKTNAYAEKQVHKISAIMDAIKAQGFKVFVLKKNAEDKKIAMGSDNNSNDVLIENLTGNANGGLGDRIIIANEREGEPGENDIVGNISIRSSDRAPNNVFATYAGHRDYNYADKLNNILKVMREEIKEEPKTPSIGDGLSM